jgi:farnesyl diphosphate synthase
VPDFSLDTYWSTYRQRIETMLAPWIPNQSPTRLGDAMRHAVLQGGKRLRPLLAIATAEALNGDANLAAEAGCIIELIHAHSLVHDDLPCMDNDVLRRGKPTVHVAFDEATALLAGDALLVRAFEVLSGLKTSRLADFLQTISEATAAMIRGQMADMEPHATEEELCFVHRNKTGAIINAAVRVGALASDADERQLKQATRFAEGLGLAFQIVDDILDETATAAELGKTPGKDREAHKGTFVTLYGIEQARIEAERQVKDAIMAIQDWPHPEALVAIAQFVLTRKY